MYTNTDIYNWNVLKLQDSRQFYVHSSFEETGSGYHLIITDLIRVWERKATKRDIELEKKVCIE
jgi:hypothetical protein